MILSKFKIKNLQSDLLQPPPDAIFDLPEKVLQFGTGVLLRGLPDYFIDKANRKGIFNGRVIVVKSTDGGDATAFEKQDGMYTQCIRGIENGQLIEENIINSSISRVLSAKSQWNSILQCAHLPQLKIIISNTTEVGIQLTNDNIHKHPPESYPGKLLAFLYERYQAFNGSAGSGMVIVPTELIVDNGKKLESIVLELAHLNGLSESFIQWLESSNHFCSSLVDRIVPGKPAASQHSALQKQFGYKDELMIMSESYRLWAIEGNDHVRSILSFADADDGVVIEPKIDLFRELKLRMLNGTHSIACGIAFLSGFETVCHAMENKWMTQCIEAIMMDEIAPSIPYKVEQAEASQFGNRVLDRFRNVSIEHLWINITMQYTSKLKMRIVPVLMQHYRQFGSVPEYIAAGFAAWLLFMKGVKKADGNYYGVHSGKEYIIKDDSADLLFRFWKANPSAESLAAITGNSSVWGEDLNSLEGFTTAVSEKLRQMMDIGVDKTIHLIQLKKVIA
ncbi:MAG: tagaturonate reductase [Chitinophagaceae bacterium]|nr:tagaturonate reductase [Chitinophagaceae bacterium]